MRDHGRALVADKVRKWRLDFGKHRGKSLDKIPVGYLKWCVGNLHPVHKGRVLDKIEAELFARGVDVPERMTVEQADRQLGEWIEQKASQPKSPTLNRESRKFNASERRRASKSLEPEPPELACIPPWESVPERLRHLVPAGHLYD